MEHTETLLYKNAFEASNTLSLDALAGMELDTLFQKATAHIANILQVTCCKVLECMPDHATLLLRAGVGWKQGMVGHAHVECDLGSQAGYTLQSKHPVIVKDLRTETRFHGPALLQEHGVISGISVIISGCDHAWGVLGAHSTTQREFDQDDVDFVQIIANILALAIERKTTEEALRNTQRKHQQALHIAHLGYCELDPNTKHITFSSEACQIFEQDPKNASVSYRSLLGLIHPEDRKHTTQKYKNALKHHHSFDITHRLLMANGQSKWVNVKCATLFSQNGQAFKSMAIVQDITERKKSEQRLQLISQFCATASGEDFFPALVCATAQALDVNIVFVSELLPGHAARTLAMSVNQQLEENIEYPLAGTPCEQIIKGKTLSFPANLQQSFPQDQWLEHVGGESYVGVPMMDDHGQVIGHMGMIDDKPILNQQQVINTLIIFAERAATELTQKRIKASLNKLAQAIEHAGESILITDQHGMIEYINPAFTKISGYSADEAIGQTPRLLNSGNQDQTFYTEMWRTITHGQIWHGKVIDKNKDGSFYPAMLTIAPIMDADGEITHFVGTHADMTDLDHMEKQFHQAQKMEAIGTLVGGIAHDFNNMLAGITGNLFLASKNMQDRPLALQKLHNIEQLSFRAADMIKQLLTFARKDRVEIKNLPFTSFIKETLKFLSTSIPENITVQQELCGENLSIKGDATQLHQMLMNLVNNARDALEDIANPCINIRLEAFQTDKKFLKQHVYFKAGQYAHLSVTDNGCGISEDHIPHLFEPFFTTKEQGKGTGLGLAMAFGAIKTHHGFIEVESSEQKGTTFHIFLPLLKQSEETQTPTRHNGEIYSQGELILLADDEPHVRKITAEVLETIGYKVLQAKDGIEAFELFSQHQHDIDLALLDIVMPHCGGLPLAERIRAIAPQLPIVFLTGYDKEHALDHNIPPIQNSCVLSKPIQFDALNRIIREQIAASTQPS